MKLRCEHCGAKVGDGFDFCPHCGSRLMREPVESVRSDNRGCRRSMGCLVVVMITVVAVAIAATVWLVREHDNEEARRVLLKHREDSVRAEVIRLQREARSREDSLRMVRDSVARVDEIMSNFADFSDFVELDNDGLDRLRDVDETIRRLRERGYQTLRRGAGGDGVLMGINAEYTDGKVSGVGDIYSVVGLWSGRIEVGFCSDRCVAGFMNGVKGRGLTEQKSGAWGRARGGVKVRCFGRKVELTCRQ